MALTITSGILRTGVGTDNVTINVTGPGTSGAAGTVTFQWYYQVGWTATNPRIAIPAGQGGTGANLVWTVPPAQYGKIAVSVDVTDGTTTIVDVGGSVGYPTTGLPHFLPCPTLPTFPPRADLFGATDGFVLLGDSLTGTLATGLAPILAGVKPGGATLYNCGHGGSAIVDWASSAPVSGAGQSLYDGTKNNYNGALKAITDAKAAGNLKAIFCGLGTNGSFNSGNQAVYGALVAALQAAAPGVPIFLWGMFAVLGGAYTNSSQQVLDANAAEAAYLTPTQGANLTYFNNITDLPYYFADHPEMTDRVFHPNTTAGFLAQASLILKPAYDYLVAGANPNPFLAWPRASGVIGDSANLSVKGTGGVPPYTYQWYKSVATGFTPGPGNAVPGATGPTLTDSNLAPNSTSYYRCIATDAAGQTAVLPEVAMVVGAIMSLPLATIKAIAGESFRLPWESN